MRKPETPSGDPNNDAYIRARKDGKLRKIPTGHYVGVSEGKIVGSAPSAGELIHKVRDLRKNVLIKQKGSRPETIPMPSSVYTIEDV